MIADRRMREAILEVVHRIVERYQPKKVFLFGSYAYGKPDEDSDIDLLIVKETDKRPIERWLEVKKLLRGCVPMVSVSPLVYTEKELEERMAMKDFFIEEIFQRGELLYG